MSSDVLTLTKDSTVLSSVMMRFSVNKITVSLLINLNLYNIENSFHTSA